MSLRDDLENICIRDRKVWDSCASIYDRRIVNGHPDVLAYEAFEEDLLDNILNYLILETKRAIHLLDVGCGSGRLHQRYGLKTADVSELPKEDIEKVNTFRMLNNRFAFDPLLAVKLSSIDGIDFSANMLKIAEERIRVSGLSSLLGAKLFLRQGSAFDLQPLNSGSLPIAVSVCNSIGVMQGPSGAVSLFESMRRAVEDSGGIAIISAYRKEAVITHALGNYESTMDVSGQPYWLVPDTYASPEYIHVPYYFKRSYDPHPGIIVDVYDREGNRVEKGYVLQRDEKRVREVIETGRIRTSTDYESYWHGFEIFDEWIRTYWPSGRSYHIAGQILDAVRAKPVQLAILDITGKLKELLKNWRTEI